MKEIDFLPEWYKEGKRRQVHMRRQYAALALIFVAMMIYNLATTHTTSKATAELLRIQDQRLEAESALHEFNIITKELNTEKTKADLIDQIDSKIDVAAALAELSHVVGESVVLHQVEFIAEPLPGGKQDAKSQNAGIRSAGNPNGREKRLPLGGTRFKILLIGIAAGPADVAELVCRLGDSTYFRQVYPSYSRPKKVRVPAGKVNPGAKDQTAGAPGAKTETIEASEFEITCYLANYEEMQR